MAANFDEILASPVATFDEGLEQFRGRGMLRGALQRVAADLERQGIEYCVVGAVALSLHDYRRFTEDIDILVTPQGRAV